jgi:hypothetical protein
MFVGQTADNLAKYGNIVTRAANNLINGEVIRVPVGFAGSMVYDTNDAKVIPVESPAGGAVKFTTYSDNQDEYVGKAGHGSYGSAFIGINKRSDAFLFKDVDVEAEYNKAKLQANAATAMWRRAGNTVAFTEVMGRLTAAVNPIKKLGLAVYTGIQTGNALVSLINKEQNPVKSSAFDADFNPDAHPGFVALPIKPKKVPPDSVPGAGTKPHQQKPNIP